nr:MAG TPA: tail tube protein [Caudoviricetes sp.]
MVRQKNALRKHFIADYTSGQNTPPTEDSSWLRLAKKITTISDNSEEQTESEGDYAGDGTEVEVLTGRSESWSAEGTYDPGDAAQKLIASKKRKVTDDERLVWHKIEETNGDVVIGLAKVLNIIAGSGDATAYEEFKCDINFTEQPEVKTASSTPSQKITEKVNKK